MRTILAAINGVQKMIEVATEPQTSPIAQPKQYTVKEANQGCLYYLFMK